MKEFYALFNLISRDGAQAFFHWLRITDFFIAPASTGSHGAWEGGLLAHSVGTAQILLDLTEKNNIVWEHPESPVLVGLLHDVCKVNSYRAYTKNYRDTAGYWQSRTEYMFDEKLPLGHGEKSLFLISRYMRLTDQEALCLRWHMTNYESRAEREASEKAITLCSAILWVRTADRLEAQRGSCSKIA